VADGEVIIVADPRVPLRQEPGKLRVLKVAIMVHLHLLLSNPRLLLLGGRRQILQDIQMMIRGEQEANVRDMKGGMEGGDDKIGSSGIWEFINSCIWGKRISP
jgi:hypothetical protein